MSLRILNRAQPSPFLDQTAEPHTVVPGVKWLGQGTSVGEFEEQILLTQAESDQSGEPAGKIAPAAIWTIVFACGSLASKNRFRDRELSASSRHVRPPSLSPGNVTLARQELVFSAAARSS